MYIHLGQDTSVRQSTVLGIFDLDTSTVSRWTRDYLKKAEDEKRVVNVSYELPKSFIVCDEDGRQTVYISQLSSKALIKRAAQTGTAELMQLT